MITAGLAACGGGGSSGHSTTPSPSATATATATATPVFTSPALTGTATSVTFSAAFTKTLDSFGVAPTVVAPATRSGATLTFPITGGKATVYAKGAKTPQVTGTVMHSGGLTLATRGIRVELQKFVLKLGAAPTLAGTVLINGQALGGVVTMFDLDTSTMTAPVRAGASTTLRDATVYVDAAVAASLNAALGLSGTSKSLPTAPRSLKVGTADIVLSS